MRHTLTPTVLTLGLILPGLALAQDVTPTDAKSVARALSFAGHTVEIAAESATEPRIDASVDGLNYTIYFYNCDAPSGCDALEFYSAFELAKPVTVDLINQWNSNELLGTAFTEDGQTVSIAYAMPIAGGLPAATFGHMVDWWETALSGYAGHIGY